MRIAIGGIHTECATYNHHLQKRADFTVVSGMEMVQKLALNISSDVEVCPLFHARSVPGGPVTSECYGGFKAAFLTQLADALPLDGVYLAMHGAMHVEGLEDAEGDWISAVRDVIGPDLPLAVSYDLHGNLTQQIVDQIDVFAAYRTAPHIDMDETCNRAFGLLLDHLRGGPKPVVSWAPVPVLMSGERSATTDSPARDLYALLPGEDRLPGVLDTNLLVGYVWADTPRATACAVVTGTDATATQLSANRLAQAYWDARAQFCFGVATVDLKTCLDMATLEFQTQGPVILADSGDNPTGGGVGDRSDVLAAVLKAHITGAVFAGIADETAAVKAAQAGLGACLVLEIGGDLESSCTKIIQQATVLQIIGTPDDADLKVMVEIAGNRVILTRQRRPFHNLMDFHCFGVDPALEKFLVVKSGYLSPELAPLASPALMALTDGAVNQDIPELSNHKRSSPMYPFQTDFEFAPQARLSKRAEGEEA